MSTIHAIEDAIETALSTWIANTTTHHIDLSRFNVRHEEEGTEDNLTLPAIILHVERETEEPQPLVGVWRLKCTVTMLTQADDTATTQLEQDWNDLVAVLYWDELASQLTTSTLKVYAVRYDSPASHDHEERHWRHQLQFSIWACAL